MGKSIFWSGIWLVCTLCALPAIASPAEAFLISVVEGKPDDAAPDTGCDNSKISSFTNKQPGSKSASPQWSRVRLSFQSPGNADCHQRAACRDLFGIRAGFETCSAERYQ